MGAELFPVVFTTGWASGVNAYLVVLILGLAERLFTVDGIPDALANPWVLLASALLFLLEAFADKIPYLDSAWDSVHTVIRPVIGALLGYLFGHEHSSLDAAFMATTGGVTALAAHLVKAGARTAVNTSPEPVSNIVVSTSEDVTVAGVIGLAFLNPWVAAVVAALLLVIGAVVVVAVLRRLRAVKRRYDQWGEDVGIAQPRRRRRGGGGHDDRGPPLD